jgi:ubiquinone/menaquinone biosynthesis C-methylase UbiE
MFSTPSICLSQFNIEPGMIVADLGSGTGAYVFELAHRVGPTGKVFALEVQKGLVDKLSNECKQKGYSHVSVIWDDLDDIDGIALQDLSIDRVVVANTLFQLEDIQKFATEVKRILKPKGQALIIDWADSFGGIGPTPSHVVTETRARELFEKVGLYTVKTINAGEHHYGFVVQCKQ